MGRKKSASRPRMVSITITDDAHNILAKLKHASSEPIWKVFDRIIGSYVDKNGEVEEDLLQARDGVQKWQKRALEAEKKLELTRQAVF